MTYLVSLRYKKHSWLGNHNSVLFLMKEGTTRKQFVEFIKNYDEDIDLRTARFEDFGGRITLNTEMVPIQSDLGTVTLV